MKEEMECPKCGGEGEYSFKDENGDTDFTTCEVCRGRGLVEKKEVQS